jgi:hypothetical protein
MRNTGTVYGSAERIPVVLPEMAQLLPPLSEEQLGALESDILKNGCYAPIIVNEDMVIIDGHNQYVVVECCRIRVLSRVSSTLKGKKTKRGDPG